jgi:hypothetical protein
MPLSRHFYSIDEVQASFYHSLSLGRVEESLFWCQELIDSGCIGETISILFEAWLWNVGPFYIQWFLTTFKTLSSEELSETDILNATYQLAIIPNRLRDHSLWNILVLGSSRTIPDRLVNKYPKEWIDKDPIETHFIGALYQHKALNAWWISKYIEPSRVWELIDWFYKECTKYSEQYYIYFNNLREYNKLLGFQSDEVDNIIRCIAISSICIDNNTQKESFDTKWIQDIDMRIRQEIDIWNKNIGRKTRRIFKIQASYLYGKTYRGELKWTQNTLQQLYTVEKYLIGCPFWDEIISPEYGIINEDKIQWKSDDLLEEFYETYFPNDIPDEWSKEEQLKSHGDGILGPSDITNIWKYSRNYFSGKSRLVWGTKYVVGKLLESNKSIYSDCNLYNYISQLYISNNINLSAKMTITSDIISKLKPVIKIKTSK